MSKPLYISNIVLETKVEGPGVRNCIWLQGCDLRCPGCFAAHTWEKEHGTVYSISELCEILNTHNIRDITISGGEPFFQKEELLEFFEEYNPLSVILFTGYDMEELLEMNNEVVFKILGKTDVLITGRFKKDLPEKKRPFVGSENQRFWFLKDTYSWTDFRKLRNSIEIRVKSDGQIILNGMESPGKTKIFDI